MKTSLIVLQRGLKTVTFSRFNVKFANLISDMAYRNYIDLGFTPTLIIKLKSYKHDYLLQQSNSKRKV